jgi:hypothetical protein
VAADGDQSPIDTPRGAGLPAQPGPGPEARSVSPAARRRDRRPSWLGFLMTQFKYLLALGVIVVLLGFGTVPWLLSQPARLTQLIARAAPQLQADVTFERARIGWAGPIVLEGVRVAPRNGAAAPLSIDRIEGSHGLVGILLSAGDIGRVRLVGLRGNIAFAHDRSTNLVGLVTPGEAGEAAVGPTRSPVRVRLEADDALLQIAGPWTPEPWVSDPIRLRAALAPNAAGFSEWTLEPVEVFRNAVMQPGVAQGVLVYIAPVLANATRTAGRFSLVLDGARLTVGDPAGLETSGVLAMHEVVLGPGPLVGDVLSSLPVRLPPPPAVLFADEARVEFSVADGLVWHRGLEFGLPLAKPGQRLDVESSGTVRLADGALDLTLRLPIPEDLPQDRPLLAAVSGKTVSLGIGGSLAAPEVNFNGSIRAAASETVTDLIGTILDEVQRRRAERRLEPPLARPGRGRILRRVAPPTAP